MSTDPHFSQGPGPLTSEGRYVTFTPAAKFCISFSLLYTISPFWCFVQVKILGAMLILHEFRQVHSSLFFRLLSPLMEMLQTLTSNLQVSMAGILQWERNHSLWGALQIYCCVTLFCFLATKSTRVPLGWYSLPFLLKVWNLGLSSSLHCAMVYLRMATRHQHYDSFVYQCDISVWQHSISLVDACVHCSHSGVLFASDDNANDDDDLFAVLSKANKSAKSVSAFLMT